MKNEKKEQIQFYNKWWFWIIVLIIIVVLCVTFIIGMNGLIDKKDNSSLSSYQVKEMLEREGYVFETSNLETKYITHYVIIRNNKEGIRIQKYINPLIGTEISFNNKSYNDKLADVSSESANKTDEERKQYKAYLNWLNDMGLTKSQVVDVLEYFDSAQ